MDIKMSDFKDFKEKLLIKNSHNKETKDYRCLCCGYYNNFIRVNNIKLYKSLNSFKRHMKTKKHLNEWNRGIIDNLLLDNYIKDNKYYIPEVGNIIFEYVGRKYDNIIKSLRDMGRTEEEINKQLDYFVKQEEEGIYNQMIR